MPPALPMVSQLCKDHLPALSRTAQMSRPVGPHCFHTLELSSILHWALREQFVISRTSQRPTQVLETTGPPDMHPRAAGAQPHNLQPTCCKALQLQRWSSAQKAPLRLRSCLPREEQGMPESRNHQPPHSDWASPQAPDQRETQVHYSLSSSRSQGKSSPLVWDHAVCQGPKEP